MGTHIGFVQLGNKLVPIRECGFLGLPGTDNRLEYTWTMARRNDIVLSRSGLLTREVTVYPGKAAFPFPNGSSGNHNKLEAHLFEPLDTIQSIWNREGIVDSVRRVVFLHLALEGKQGQCRAEKLRKRPYRSLPGRSPAGILWMV